jgi:hypothetical protein
MSDEGEDSDFFEKVDKGSVLGTGEADYVASTVTKSDQTEWKLVYKHLENL